MGSSDQSGSASSTKKAPPGEGSSCCTRMDRAIHNAPVQCRIMGFLSLENISEAEIGRQAKSVDENTPPGIF
ncbi:MAG: hypothetical protein CME19_15710 [Gemmatimonadetes bacterium]|nr:hypothetical protein [Gemmatimonadota bacterium]